jgi:hypothetical protein
MVDLPPPVGPTSAMVSPWFDGEGEVVQHRFLRARSRNDVVELDVAANVGGRHGRGFILNLRRFIQPREDALRRSHRLLHRRHTPAPTPAPATS